MWRGFAELSRAMDEDSSSKGLLNGEIKRDIRQFFGGRTVIDPRELAYVEIQSHNIVLALMKSIDQGCEEVNVERINMTFEKAETL